jgi:hypothetical protein
MRRIGGSSYKAFDARMCRSALGLILPSLARCCNTIAGMVRLVEHTGSAEEARWLTILGLPNCGV